jgi:hypothetical protein
MSRKCKDLGSNERSEAPCVILVGGDQLGPATAVGTSRFSLVPSPRYSQELVSQELGGKERDPPTSVDGVSVYGLLHCSAGTQDLRRGAAARRGAVTQLAILVQSPAIPHAGVGPATGGLPARAQLAEEVSPRHRHWGRVRPGGAVGERPMKVVVAPAVGPCSRLGLSRPSRRSATYR